MKTLFWTSALLLFYVYAGYPLLLALAARLRGPQAQPPAAEPPTVTMLLTVYNEEAVIEAKLRNILALAYPAGRFEALIVSDGCTDRTEDLIKAVDDPRVRLLVQPGRGGKTRALNAGAARAAGEILVFTDANAMLEPDALLRLAERFADPGVGLVSGRTSYVDAATGKARASGLYRRYEEWIKARESQAFSIVGADGALYALRRELYEDLPPSIINDLAHTFDVVAKGFRAVSEDAAICLEEADDEEIVSFPRQTRILTQSWRVVLSRLFRPALLARPGYVWEVLSHKVLRWLSLPLMAALLVSSLILVADHPFYLAAFAAQAGCYLLAAVGSASAGGLSRTAYHFLMINASSLLALYEFIMGKTFVTWEPRSG